MLDMMDVRAALTEILTNGLHSRKTVENGHWSAIPNLPSDINDAVECNWLTDYFFFWLDWKYIDFLPNTFSPLEIESSLFLFIASVLWVKLKKRSIPTWNPINYNTTLNVSYRREKKRQRRFTRDVSTHVIQYKSSSNFFHLTCHTIRHTTQFTRRFQHWA